MNKELFFALLAVHFGRGAYRPVRAAAFRLVIAAAAAAGSGVLVARLVSKALIPSDLPVLWCAAAVAVAVFAGTALLLLSIGASQEQMWRRSALSRQASTWPLSPFARWLLEITPPFLIALLAGLFIMPIAGVVGARLHVPAYIMGVATTWGFGAAIGLAVSPRPRAAPLRLLIYGLLVAASLKVLLWAGQPNPHTYSLLLIFAVIGGLGLCYAGLALSYYQGDRSPPERRVVPLVRLGPANVYGWWYIATMLRNHRTASSLAFCTTLTVATALLVQWRHLADVGANGWLLFNALLVSTFAADVRGLVRRYKPTEIFGLKGIGFFVASEVQASVLLCLLIGLPLFVVLACSPGVGITADVLLYVSLQTAAALLGLLASTVFVPRTGEIGAQFFAALTPTLLLFGVLRFAHVGSFGTLGQTAAWLLAAGASTGLIYGIEKIRSKHYGRF